MPIYEYKCGNCKNDFEELIFSVSQEKALLCPHCGDKKVEKQLSMFGFGGSVEFSSSAPSDAGCTSCSSKKCSSCN